MITVGDYGSDGITVGDYGSEGITVGDYGSDVSSFLPRPILQFRGGYLWKNPAELPLFTRGGKKRAGSFSSSLFTHCLCQKDPTYTKFYRSNIVFLNSRFGIFQVGPESTLGPALGLALAHV